MTATATPAAGADAPPLSPARTPRPRFQLTRRLVGVSKWPLILLTTIYAIQVSDQYLLPSVFPYIKEDFHLSDTSLGILSGSYFIVVTLGTVPFGILADRRRRTKIIAWGTTAWGGAMIGTGLAPGYASLLLFRSILGISEPCDNPTSQSLLADYYPVNQRSKVMGVYQIGQLIGFFLLPIGATMAASWGWRAPFFFFAIPGFIVSILAWSLREPARGAQDRRHQRLTGELAAPSKYDAMPTRAVYGEILRVPTFRAAMVSSGIASLFYGGIGTWTVTFLVRYHDLSVAEGATAVSLFALGGLVGALLSGYVADWLTYAGLRSARVVLSGVCRIAVFPLMFVAFSVSSTAIMLILFTLGAVVLTASQPPLAAARLDVLHPSLRGRGTSLDTVVQGVCSAASPIIFGVLADRIGLRGAFLALIPLAAVGGLVLLLFGATHYTRDEKRVADLVATEARQVGDQEDTDPAIVSERLARQETGPGADVLLEVEGIDVSYGAIQVLFGTDLVVPRGGCHALLGRNGVGKTTLLRAIAGLVDPQAGRILFNGHDLSGVPPDQRVKLGLTLVAGGQATFASLSVFDNLWLGAYPFADSNLLVAERLDAVLEIFPALKDRLNQSGGTLSGGEQQMMAVGRALMAGPDLLLVDELSLGLAPLVIEELVRVMGRIVELGTTVLMVEQSVNVAMTIADDVLLMEKGVVRALGSTAELESVEAVGRLMVHGWDEP